MATAKFELRCWFYGNKMCLEIWYDNQCLHQFKKLTSNTQYNFWKFENNVAIYFIYIFFTPYFLYPIRTLRTLADGLLHSTFYETIQRQSNTDMNSVRNIFRILVIKKIFSAQRILWSIRCSFFCYSRVFSII